MLLLLLLAIFALIAYQKPLFAAGLILAMLPTYLIRYHFLNVPTTLLELLIVIFVGIVLITNFTEIKKLSQFKYFYLLIGLFLLTAISATIISPGTRAALGLLKAFFIEPILFFFCFQLLIKQYKDFTTPLNLLFLGAVIISAFGIIQHFTLIHLPLQFWGAGEEVLRITSFFDYPNALALYLAPILSFFLTAFILDEKTLNKKNLGLGLAVMLLALFLTYSRGAWIAIVVTTGITLLYHYPIKKILPMMVLAGLVLINVPIVHNRLILINRDRSSDAHLQLLTAGITQIHGHPILGDGLAGFPQALKLQHFSGEILNYPHNILLNFWLETGLLGLLAFLAIILICLWRWIRQPNWYTTAAMAFLLTLLVHGLVDVPYFKNDLALLFWFIIAIFFIPNKLIELPKSKFQSIVENKKTTE